MSTFATALYAASAPVLDLPFITVLQALLALVAVVAFVLVFKPLLIGIVRALVLLVRPKLSREQRLARALATRA